MKIVIDARMWNETGIGRYIRNLVLGLEKKDTINDYYLLLKNNEFNNLNLNLNPNFHKVLSDFSWYTIVEQIKLYQVLTKLKPDLYHSPNINFSLFYLGKKIITIHDLIMLKQIENESVKRLIKRVILKWILKFFLQNSITILTVSNYVKKQIQDELKINGSKIRVIYNCIESFDKATIAENNKKDYLLYVGNTYGHKNIKFLINAMLQLNRKLIIVGKEDDSIRNLKKLVLEKGLKDLVVFEGYVDDQRLAELYSKAFAYVFPTLDEGFGLPGLEAIKYKCPVICSDIPVLREIYKESALFFKVNSTKDLKEQLEKLDDKNLREQKVNIGLKILENYDCKIFVEETLQVYQKLYSKYF